MIESSNTDLTEQSRQMHLKSDVDSGTRAQHHTLGKSPMQAAPGDHVHDYSPSTHDHNADLLLVAQILSPVGDTKFHMGTKATVPTNYMVCDGADISRTTYAALFAKLSTRHGSGSGTTFMLPDFDHRTFVGVTADGDAVNEGVAEASRLVKQSHDHSHGAGTLATANFGHNQANNTQAGGAQPRLESPVNHNHNVTGSTASTDVGRHPYVGGYVIMRVLPVTLAELGI